MKVQVGCYFLFLLVATCQSREFMLQPLNIIDNGITSSQSTKCPLATSSHNTKCPFDYVFHFGDGVTDIGNSVLIPPEGTSNPATRFPYGSTCPGHPNGRWSDGLNDFDFAGADFGFPVLTPYLASNASSSNAVIFSVARSPVLDREFFTSRGIDVPSYAVSLRAQLDWFRNHLKSICSTEKACADILGNALILLGDIEGNDIGYPLSQGKSIADVQSYSIPQLVIQTQIDVIRELIGMGATRIVVPGNAPIGCYPYILNAMATNDSTAYDDLGCLKSVNDFITSRNNDLHQGVNNLIMEFPNVTFSYGSFGDGVLQVLREAGPNALKACCGIGGKYNYDSKRFCGCEGVPVCSNPNEYIFWDGIYFTHEAFSRMEKILVGDALVLFNCTTQLSASM